MKKIIILVVLPIVASLFAPFPGSTAEVENDIPSPEKTAGVDLRDPQVIDKGMEMLNSTCGGYCHGTAGRGYKGPPLRNRTDLTTDSMIATIKYGRKRAGRLMPAWNGTLSEAEMWTAIAAIVSLRHVDGDAPGAKPAAH
ncbi:MAG TPA: cytochrome c [Burkholderiales bacterium]|nr:cytochrome c [Burkholderiales bacterium]